MHRWRAHGSKSSSVGGYPVDLLNEFESLSQSKFNLSFAARKEDELSLAASKMGLSHQKLMGNPGLGQYDCTPLGGLCVSAEMLERSQAQNSGPS